MSEVPFMQSQQHKEIQRYMKQQTVWKYNSSPLRQCHYSRKQSFKVKAVVSLEGLTLKRITSLSITANNQWIINNRYHNRTMFYVFSISFWNLNKELRSMICNKVIRREIQYIHFPRKLSFLKTTLWFLGLCLV